MVRPAPAIGDAAVVTLTALCMAMVAPPTFAQFPAKPVTLIVPFAVGGSTDLVARLVAQHLTGVVGQPVLVENRVGAGGSVGWSAVARATPDGYTLLTTELSFSIAPGLQPRLPFDARKDFTHVVTAVQVPHVLVVNPTVPAKTIKELIALARTQPGKMNYGSGGNGTNTHLGAELFKDLAGDLNIVHVPYKGAGAVLQDLIGGQVQLLVSAMPTVLSQIRAGKLRALMVTNPQRVAALPDVPGAVESGLPQMDMQFWIGFALPAGAPRPVVERLNRTIISALQLPDARKRLDELGLDYVGNTPEAATRLVAAEMERWAAIIKARGITAD